VKIVVIRSVYRDDRLDPAMALSFLSIPDGVSADARTVRHLAGKIDLPSHLKSFSETQVVGGYHLRDP
jgi:hypothetical protein